MTISLEEAVDEAQYVTVSSDHKIMAVWYGANSVTFYLIEEPSQIAIVDSVSIGEYKFGETTREEAIDTIQSVFAEYRGRTD